jgi:hypothetical protein
MRWTARCTAALAFALLPIGAQAQQVAGQVLWLSGVVESVDLKGVSRPLAKGDILHEGDTVRTGADAYAQLIMKDEALLAVRPETTLRLQDYRYTGREDGSERAVYDLIRGGFRSITGAIGKTNKERFLIRTDNVLVGIRGTDHETFIVPGQGTYNRVTQGGTYLRSATGRVDLEAGQVAFASLAGTPSLMQRTPDFMHLTKVSLPAGAPFNDGVVAHGKRELPDHVTMPALPAQALGDNAGNGNGWGRGGRCGGPCAGVVNGGVGKGLSKRPDADI